MMPVYAINCHHLGARGDCAGPKRRRRENFSQDTHYTVRQPPLSTPGRMLATQPTPFKVLESFVQNEIHTASPVARNSLKPSSYNFTTYNIILCV